MLHFEPLIVVGLFWLTSIPAFWLGNRNMGLAVLTVAASLTVILFAVGGLDYFLRPEVYR